MYCNFHFSTSLKNQDALVNAVCLELEQRKDYLNSREIESLYFGGGTPSFLAVESIAQVIEAVNKYFDLEKNAEITLEANPDDLTREKLRDIKTTGINRLSIGVQSFDEHNLQFLGRVHNAEEALRSIQSAQDIGFDNLTIDLIYGIPGSSKARWENDLNWLKQLAIPHFSAYALTLEPKTIFAHRVKKGITQAVDEEQLRQDFLLLDQFAIDNGYLHYEISNFARPDKLAVHNLNYWKRKPYLGLGPSAHSYNIESRQWNVAVNSEYIRNVKSDEAYFEKETLNEVTKFNEYLMLSLRTMWGISLDELPATENIKLSVRKKLTRWVDKKLTTVKQGRYILTPEGMLISDSIIADLFI